MLDELWNFVYTKEYIFGKLELLLSVIHKYLSRPSVIDCSVYYTQLTIENNKLQYGRVYD
jgi:hypothetical protein